MESNHRCTRMCYGDQDIDFDEDHRFSMFCYSVIQFVYDLIRIINYDYSKRLLLPHIWKYPKRCHELWTDRSVV